MAHPGSGNTIRRQYQATNKALDVLFQETPSSPPSRPSLAAGPELSIPAGAPDTLTDVLRIAAQDATPGRVVRVGTDGREVVLWYPELRRIAERILGGLRASGATPGEEVILQVEVAEEFVPALWACILGGFPAVPVGVAGSHEGTGNAAQRLRDVWTALDQPLVLAGTGLSGPVCSALGGPARVVEMGELTSYSPDPAWHPSPPDANAVLLLSSGTTGRPKLIQRTHHNLLRACQGSMASAGIAGRRVTFLNWLPLDHNAALTASLTLLAAGAHQVHLGTRDVLEDPERWLHALHRYRVSHTGGTNYSLGLINGCLASAGEREWDFSSLERLTLTAEPVVARTVRTFLKHTSRYGLRPEALRTSYGMSEVGGIARLAEIHLDEGADSDGFMEVGTPFPGITLRVVDAQGRVVPEGTEGRIQVRGETVTPGYAHDPEQTRESFTADGWFDTGDAGFLRAGSLTITGREKDVLIVNGLNIQSQEIEAAVEEVNGVERGGTAVCPVRIPGRDTDGAAVFVHTILVGGEERAALRREVRRVVATRFGATVAHVLLVDHEEIPRTALGKVRRSALRLRLENGDFAREIAEDADAGRGEEPGEPRSDLEREICAVWADVLGVERVGVHDHFLGLGGHSLLAARIAARVRAVSGVEVPLRVIFEQPTVEELAEAVEALRRGAGEREARTPVQAPLDGPLPLSFAQERLWFLDRLQPGGSAYNLSRALRLRGPLDLPALERALAEIVHRHETLRTTFHDRGGNPVQVIAPAAATELRLEDLSDLAGGARDAETVRRVREAATAPYDLARGPLFRAELLRLSAEEHVLLLCMHHIVSDGWSIGVLYREVEVLYAAFLRGEPSPLAPLPVRYADHVVWQRTEFTGEVLERQLDYWRARLEGAPTLLELPTDHVRPAVQSHRGAACRIALPREIGTRVAALGRAEGATLFMTLLAAFQVLLAKYSGQDDVVVGTPLAGRNRLELEGLIGLFVNTLALRTDLSGAERLTFRQLLGRVREATLGAYAHQDLPFEKLVEALQPERSLGHSPIFQVTLALQNAGGEPPRLPGIETFPLRTGGNAATFDLGLNVAEEGGELHGVLEYATDLFDASTAERMLVHLRVLLEGIVAAPDTPVAELELLPDEERRRVLEEWNRTGAEYPAGRCIHQLVEEQAARTPDAPAVVFGDDSLTYRELNGRANHLAHRLLALGVGPEARVGLCLERSLEMVVAVLAVLKAGGGYVPLDPGYPMERLELMAADSGVAVLLVHDRLHDALRAPEGVRVLNVDGAPVRSGGEVAENPATGVTAESLAYVIYTSGSTGRPKGVMNTHGGVVNRLAWMQAEYGLTPADVVLQKTPFGFDVSVWELFWPLQQGATLVMARPDGHRDPVYLQEVIARHGVTTLHFVPSMLQHFLERVDAESCASLRRVVCSGEALPPALVERFHQQLPPSVALHNLYGPTEAAVDVSYWECKRGAPTEVVPIGHPVWNTQLYVLDEALRPVPVGVPGELYIGGVQLARGYLDRPDLTADRFIPDPFSGHGTPGARLYRTGDRVRRRPDGALVYLGRLDRQVKVRGFRIELGEIEAVLRQHPAVRDAAVADYEHAPGDRRLAAYVVPDPACAPAPWRLLELRRMGALDAHRVETLPDGTEVVSLNAHETRFLYEEIFERGAYLRHGISLAGDACVFDVGANIGLFAVRVAQRCPGARVYAFEPIPPVCEALRLNAAVHGNVRVLECGLAEAEGEAVFTFYPNASILSGRHAEAVEEQAVVKAFMRNADASEDAGDEGLDALLRHRLSVRHFPCRLRTLSQVIREEGVERIDLLKIDVEKSELEVLAGIEDGDWPKIRQVAMEVHDTDGRLERARALLEERGFEVVVEQDAALAGTCLRDVYAVRPGGSAPEAPAADARWHSTAQLVRDLRRAAGARLPEYMVPGAFVPMASLPLSPNGKLDRGRLPSPEGAAVGQPHVAPRTPAESALAGIWAEVLGREDVGVRESFFELGGHSLLAMRVISRVRAVFGVELPVHAVFEAPTVTELAERVEALRRAELPTLPPVVPVERTGALPLSFAQERLWFLDRLQPESPFYNVFMARRLGGPLDVRALDRALAEIVRRHETLRTTFREEDGGPVQVISPFHEFALPVEDLSALGDEEREAAVRRLAEEEASRPFDLVAGPLLRALLLRLGGDEHVLLLGMHHVLSDAWSKGVLFRELAALYGAYHEGRESPLPELAVQYADYAVWQRRVLQGEALETQLAWWTERLAGAPALLELPTDHPRPPVQTFRGAYERVSLSGELLNRLRAMSRSEGATLHMVLLGAFQLLLCRYSGSEDVVVGTTTAGRSRPELEPLIGLFVNTLALRTNLTGDPGFREVVRRVREFTLGAYEHQELPFEMVVAGSTTERSLSYSPLVQVLFELHDMEASGVTLPGLDVRGVGVEVTTTKFDLSLELAVHDGGVSGALLYGTDLFERGTMQRMVGHLVRVLEQVAVDPDVRLSRLELATAEERVRVVEEWNRTDRPFPRETCIHELFEAQVARMPDAVALEWGGETLTYRDLDLRANRLARHLARLGVKPESRVGVLLERSLEMVVATLAVLKAGGCCVPVDTTYPPERMALMLADGGARVLLSRTGLCDALGEVDATVVRLDAIADALASESPDPVPSGASAGNVAYVFYTSGSTGRPKGVMMGHREVVQLAACLTDCMPIGPGDRVVQASNASFDAAVFEIWGALAHGATLVGIDRDVLLSAPALRDALRRERITHLYQTAALFNQHVLECVDVYASLRQLVFGAEAVGTESVRRMLSEGGPERVLHEYGPTEATVWCTLELVEEVAENAATVPIGRPVPNARTYVLDPALEPQPAGVPGELYVGGAGVVRGYQGQPALTAERFVPDPFSSEPGARMYRTGDRVRWKSDGRLEFMGRLDEQVKVRGFRIEPGEVEGAIATFPGVRQARVIVREDRPGDKRLVAYVVGDAEMDAVRSHLRQTLPEYMVPQAFVRVDRLPLTPNGKLDRRALPAPDTAVSGGDGTAPRTPVEEILAGIWAEVLRVERVGVEESFFDLGGHSLLAIRVVSRVRETLDAGVGVVALFQNPTVEGFARHLSERQVLGLMTRAGEPEVGPDSSPHRLLSMIDELSDEELDRLLMEQS